MGKTSKFLLAQWHDIRGNAKWDLIKWSFTCCLMLPAIIALAVKFSGEAPLWEAVQVSVIGYVVAIIIFLTVLYLIINFTGPKARARKAVKELTNHGKVFLRRISAIKGTDPNKYNPDWDAETSIADAAARAFIALNLTPEARELFDEGMRDINRDANLLLQQRLGSTIYGDRRREVLPKLEQRFKNLKRIAEDINKYLDPFETTIKRTPEMRLFNPGDDY
jgi:hypothetical protein